MRKECILEIRQCICRKLLNFSLILFCLLSTRNVIGQNQTTFNESLCEVGTAYPRIDAPEKFYFSRGDTIISIKIEKENLYIQKFDKISLKQVSSGRAENLPPDAKYEGLCELPGKLMLFYRNFVGKDSIGLYCREVDFTKGNLAPDAHHLITVYYEIHGKYNEINFKQVGFDYVDYFDLNISPDSSKFVIKYRKVTAKSGDDKDKAAIGLAAFDCANNFAKMWHFSPVLPVNNALSVFKDFTVDNSGNASMIGWVLQDDKKKKNDATAEHKDQLLVFRYGSEIMSPIITEINFTGKFPVDASIRALPNGKILIAGYFRYQDAVHQGIIVNRPEITWNYFHVTHGIFVYHINNNGQVDQEIIENIPAEMSKLYYNEKTISSGMPTPPGFWGLQIKNVLVNSDGSSLLVGEQYSQFNPNGNATEYRFCNIVVMRLSPGGKTSWIQSLKKWQRSDDAHDRSSVSYKYGESETDYFFFFLNQLDNLTKEPGESWNPYLDGRDGYMAVYRVDKSTGKSTLLPMFDIDKVNGKKLKEVSPYRIIQVGEKDFVMEAYIGDKSDCLFKFSVPRP